MSWSPSVTVVIPAKNEQANLARCLDSLASLRYRPVEVIVVDNGSQDGTVEVARAKGARVLQRPDLNISGLRNHGAQVAVGEVLAFVDADCEVDPDWVAAAVGYLEDPQVGCAGSTAVAPPSGTWVQRVWGAFRTRREAVGETSWLNSMNMVVRKSAFCEVGGFSESLATCEDVDFCYRLGQHYRIIYDPAVRVIHYGEADTLGRFFQKELWRGQGNLAGLRSHGLVLAELPSLLLPLYLWAAALLTLAAGVAALRWPGLRWALPLGILALVAPPLLFGVYAARASRRARYFPGYVVLFATYALARAAALFYHKKR